MAKRAQSPRDRAQRIVSDLAKRGESRAKDLQKAAREIAERSARSRKELVSLIQKEIRRQIRAIGVATREDIDRLQRRVRELEKGSGSRPTSRARKPRKSTKSSER
jgi:polyhydroxyalkanoate synthesis regulator phasin